MKDLVGVVKPDRVWSVVMRMLKLAFVLVTVSLAAHADEPRKLKGSKKVTAPKIDLDLPAFEAIPKDQKLEKKGSMQQQNAPASKRLDEGYSVVRVVSGKSFMRSPDGAKASTPFPFVPLTSTNPYTTDKFSSVVRVKSPAKKNTRIEVLLLDQRGDTVMEAGGELRFTGGDEAEWQVDWDPTQIRAPGEFNFLVRVGGNPLGTFPVKVGADAK